MKSIFKSIMLMTAVVMAVGFTGCDDKNVNDPDSKATPSIKYIRPTDPALADQLLYGGSMGETIAIIGSGLEGVVSILFNDVEADLNPCYITEHSIICNIPAVMPTEITNTITLTTGRGNKCVYDFSVEIPAPFITSTSCEWAKAGSQMTLYGSYLFPKESTGSFDVMFPGNVEAEVVACDSSSITVTVPEGALEGAISVEGEYGIGMTKFSYKESAGMFIDCESVSTWDAWNYSGSFVHNDDSSLSGSYIELTGSAASWNWNTSGLALYFSNVLEDGSCRQDLMPAGADPADYLLKFECRINDWTDLWAAMWFSGQYNTFSIDGEEAQYHWKPFKDSTVAKGEWTTVSIPLSDFKVDKEENINDRSLTRADMGNFYIFFFGGLADDANAGTPISVYMDNLRIVHK
ncbi:MAG: IPT/TIG domain-containing protein [Alistipes sp.]|nr:IPT/TIG domain-containing protein [Alistipes sp.]